LRHGERLWSERPAPAEANGTSDSCASDESVRQVAETRWTIAKAGGGPFSMVSWEDLRLVLWIARTGSLSAAAEQLQIDVSTCSRRLNRIESLVGAPCFARLPGGVEVTSVGRLIAAHAEAMEVEASSIGKAIAAAGDSGPSRVTVTCPDSLAAGLVIPALREWAPARGSLTVDLLTGNRNMDLHRGDAHIALRLRRPAEGGLRIRKIATIGYGLYASGDYLEAAGVPASIDELKERQLVALRSDYPDLPPAVWWAEQCAGATVAVRTDRTLDRLECAAEGLGITMLPLAAARRRALVRVLAGADIPPLEVYLLAEASSLRIPEVRQVADQLAEFARQHSADFC
jgi:DNA-binding transcriptional LysR family regulator